MKTRRQNFPVNLVNFIASLIKSSLDPPIASLVVNLFVSVAAVCLCAAYVSSVSPDVLNHSVVFWTDACAVLITGDLVSLEIR